MEALLTPSSKKSSLTGTFGETGLSSSTTPLGFAGGDTNLHRYVGNSPTDATDPSGLATVVEIVQIEFGDTTGEDFLNKLTYATTGKLLDYNGHGDGDKLRMADSGSLWWKSKNWLNQEKIRDAINKGNVSVLILGACATRGMAEYLGGTPPLFNDGACQKHLQAVIGTNDYVYQNVRDKMVGHFEDLLRAGETIEDACGDTNEWVKHDPVGQQIFREKGQYPALTCSGPGIHYTIEYLKTHPVAGQ
jgi:hypothetical protein